jgi:hypothetical protein
VPTRRSAAAAALALALLGPAGCARDLALPPEGTGPRLTALVPARAHAGELVELQGSGFADDPAANRVDFPRAAAQGLARTSAGLLVRVPADAGSGPVVASTSRGTSEPLAGFEYRGLGQLRAGQVVQAVTLLHQPVALFALGPDPIIDSALYRGLVGTGASPFVARHYFQRPAAGGDSIYYAEEALRLVRFVPGVGEVAGRAIAESPAVLGHVADATAPLVVTITTTALGDQLATYAAADLAPVMPSTPLGLKVQSDPVDVGDGRFAVIAEDAQGALTLALVDPRGAVLAPLAVTLLPAPPVAVQALPVALAAGVADGERVVAVALAGGLVGLATVTPVPAWRAARAGTYSATPIAALAVAGGRVLAAKPDDGVVLGIDAAAAAVAWALERPRPTALAAGPGGVAWAAGAADNVLAALDAARGVLLGQRAADAQATSASVLAGAAWRPAGELGAALAFPVARPPALVTWPLAGAPEALVLPLAPTLVAWDPAAGDLWTGEATGVSLGGAGPIPVPGGVAWLGVSPAGLVTLGGALGLVLGGQVRPLASDLDSALAAPARAADGRLLAVGSMGQEERARLWSAAALGTAAAPTLDVVLPGFALQGAFIDGQAWVTWLEPATFEARSARLGPAGALADEVAGLIPEGLQSPNGRTMVVAEEGLLGGGLTSLRVVALEPAAGFPTADRIELPASVVGLAFDGTGERLYVVTRSPDQVLVLE